MNRYYINLLFVFSLIFIFLDLNAQQRWTISDNGGIDWTVGNQNSHSDHIEMSGKQISVVLRYGVTKEGCFIINKSLVFPLLRTIPNDTHASLMRRTDWNLLDRVTVNGCSLQNEKVEHLFLRGMLIVKSAFATTTGKVEVMRTYFPSTEKPALIEKYEIKNLDTDDIKIKIPESESVITTDVGKGVDGSYKIKMQANKTGSYKLPVGKSIVFYVSIAGYKEGQLDLNINGEYELNKRIKFVDYLTDNLVLETPNKIINRMFAFSKIRSCESIYETKNGPMHGPGGESYYAAIWANDQAEYINPYFPFIGYKYGNLSAFNSYRLFAKYMNEDWSPMPSSIIAEGTNIWNGAGDRGDAAMIAYGAARYALAYGNKKEALALWPLIKWCLEYCYRQLNDQGVVASDSDELEGRFPAGKANLCTSSLYYDALLSAAYLNKSLNGSPKLSGLYRKQAIALRENIENYFGGNVEGFDTYKYYEGNEVLRSWICMPLTVGIKDRALETIKALFSPYLCTKNGLLTQAGSKTFWDRSTLYALRGTYIAGATEETTAYLNKYSTMRLLGDHVPYAVEAWPEGNQRHLSAESGLYGRIITEGLFGIRPTGFRSFLVLPRLPIKWKKMALRKIGAFGSCFDIEVKRIKRNKIEVTIKNGNRIVTKKIIKEGSSFLCKL